MEISGNLTAILASIEDQNIVPVLGNDISKVTLPQSEIAGMKNAEFLQRNAVKDGDSLIVNLYDYLAISLWNSFDGSENLPRPCTLNNVIMQLHLEGKGAMGDYKNKVIKIVKNFTDQQMFLEPYKKIVEITDFETILTVNSDNFLERAFEAKKKHVNKSINFSMQNTAFDEDEEPDPSLPDIINLMGNILGTDFALTEEEGLEYLYTLQNQKNQVGKYMFDSIKNKSILLIGCSFPNWFMRFFIRTVSKERFWGSNKSKYVASDKIALDSDLSYFLNNNRHNTRIIKIGSDNEDGDQKNGFNNSIHFIDQLHEAWKSNKGESVKKVRYKEKIFLSYSWDDKTFVEKLKNEFEKNGVNLFFDDDFLKTGDRYADRIKTYIKKCDYFVALISKNAIKDKSRYVYDQEWRQAIFVADHTENQYIRPYLIDDTSPTNDRIPSEMRELDINKIESVDTMGNMVREFIRENNLTQI